MRSKGFLVWGVVSLVGVIVALATYDLFFGNLIFDSSASTSTVPIQLQRSPGEVESFPASRPSAAEPPELNSPAPLTTKPSQSWIWYTNQPEGYDLNVVAGWYVEDGDKSSIVIRSPGSLAILEVTSAVNRGGLSLEELTQELTEFLAGQQATRFQLLSRTELNLDSGLPATRLTYLWQVDSVDCVELMSVTRTQVGDRAIAMSAEVCQNSAPIFQADLESMQNSFAPHSAISAISS